METEKKGSKETTDLKELKERISLLSEKLDARGRSPSTGALKQGFNIPIETQRRRWSGGMVGREGNREMDGFKTRLGALRERLDMRFDKQGWQKSEKVNDAPLGPSTATDLTIAIQSKESNDLQETEEKRETEEKSEPEEKSETEDVKPVKPMRESIRRLSETLLTGLNDFRARLNEKVEKQKKRSEKMVRAQRRRSLDPYKTRLNVFRERLNAKVEGRLDIQRKKVVSPSTRQSSRSHARSVDAATETIDDRRRGKSVTPSPPALAPNGGVVLRAMPVILPPRLGLGSESDFSLSRKRGRSSSDSTSSLVEPDNRRVRFTYDGDSKFQRKEKLAGQQGGPGMDAFKGGLDATRRRSEIPPSPAPAPARRPKPTPSYTRMRTPSQRKVFSGPRQSSTPRRTPVPLPTDSSGWIRKLQELKAEFDLERARARSIVHQADVIMKDFSPRSREEIESMGVGPDPAQGLGFDYKDDEDCGDNDDDDEEY
ncbi:hypothetical protein BZA05DRAFT_418110 [Tricharina praecox]|uniref:uncharacterized protein n=1 Tax=Tricharina praecox TaxID=43433 RepID=UPI002220ACEC|nr:uncharacterized protein BZA05DRAFT_418110 [Tricharina praecox]KAI5853298.1 hypothetical protein BZA05DRAFT_418110 [Tricharina praecox]